MSINHFSSSQELIPDATWWTQDRIMDANASSNSKQHKVGLGSNSWTFHHQDPHSHVWLNSQQSSSMLLSPNPTRNFNLTSDHDHDEPDKSHQELSVDKEPMFEKPLTPSDVGKLNRLVIPKQHAEKYFPLGGDAGDKGLLLGFEDECGKSWRFRYSYWNSSQSYVLTKGWSRYVKEKQLDAGDAVLFERHRTDCERFFIGWRRRNAASAAAAKDGSVTAAQNSRSGAGDEWTRGFYPAQPYPAHHGPPHPAPYQPDCTHAGSGGSHIVPTIVPAGNMKRLRLFGVNLECQTDDSSEPSTPDGSSSLSNHGAPNYNQHQQHHYYYSSQAYSPSDHHNYVQYQTN